MGAEPVVPDEVGHIHALLLSTGREDILLRRPRHWFNSHNPEFLESRWDAEIAACGKRCRLVFPLSFDTDEEDACPDCLEMVELYLHDRPEYDRRVQEREEWIEERQNSQQGREAAFEQELRRQAELTEWRKQKRERKDAG